MSDSPIYLDGQADALSSVLAGLQLCAEVYVSGDFCGQWAVDTSGSRRVPFHLIGQGNAWLHLEGEPERRLGAGDLVIFPNDRKHIMASSPERPADELVNADFSQNVGVVTNMVCGFFEFQNRAAWPLLESLDSAIVLELSDISSQPHVRSLIDLMLAELNARSPGYYTSINQLAYLIFIHAIRQQISSGRVRTGLLTALFDSKLSRALSAIHNRPDQQWNLVSLAAEAGMGRSAFAKRFNDLIGLPAMQYLTHWRMQNASSLLQTSELSVWQIAEQCGYESEAAFRKAFKKTVGQTPGQVRNQG
ncbi:MAG: AraC family transcriptional regulator [Pseudomonadota bacterium]